MCFCLYAPVFITLRSVSKHCFVFNFFCFLSSWMFFVKLLSSGSVLLSVEEPDSSVNNHWRHILNRHSVFRNTAALQRMHMFWVVCFDVFYFWLVCLDFPVSAMSKCLSECMHLSVCLLRNTLILNNLLDLQCVICDIDIMVVFLGPFHLSLICHILCEKRAFYLFLVWGISNAAFLPRNVCLASG